MLVRILISIYKNDYKRRDTGVIAQHRDLVTAFSVIVREPKVEVDVMGDVNSSGQTTQTTTQTTAQIILDAIKNEPTISRSKLAELCGISPDGVKWQLKKLQNLGVLKHVGPDFGGHWIIVQLES